MSKSSVIKPGEPLSAGFQSFQLGEFVDGKTTAKKKARVFEFEPLTGVGQRPGETVAEAMAIMEKAKETLDMAKAQALVDGEKIREEMRAQGLEEGRTKGHEEGLEQGRIQGQTEVRESFGVDVEHARKVLQEIDNLYKTILESNEAVLVKLAMNIAERVIMQELKTSPDIIKSVFKAAMEKLQQMHEVTFKINPEDLEILESAESDMKSELGGLTNITFVKDASLARGDLVVETEAGRIDGTLKKRLESVISAVDEALKENFDVDW